MKTVTKDSIGLLKECSKGVKMGASAIDGVIDNVKNDTLKNVLKESRVRHSAIDKDVDRILKELGENGEQPPMMAKAMSWMKMNFKMMTDPTDKEAATLVYDGCNMGVKSLYEYLNSFKEADEVSRALAHRIINEEEELKDKLRNFV